MVLPKEDNFNIYRQQIVELKSLTKYINFKYSKKHFVDIIEPLNIIPISILFDAYTYHAKFNNKLKFRET
jgi:predicted transport protein